MTDFRIPNDGRWNQRNTLTDQLFTNMLRLPPDTIDLAYNMDTAVEKGQVTAICICSTNQSWTTVRM